MNRRDFLLTGASIGSGLLAACAQRPGPRLEPSVAEEHFGDPTLPGEAMVFDSTALEGDLEEAAGIRKPAEQVARRMVEIAGSHVGYSRAATPGQVEEYLALFRLPLRYLENNAYVPFCAAGVSYCACVAYKEVSPAAPTTANRLPQLQDMLSSIKAHYFLPSAACRHIVADAKSSDRRAWREPSVAPKTGWLVFFDFKRNGKPQHVGLIVQASGQTIRTVEFNTSNENNVNGGAVAYRDRRLRDVLGYVATY